MRFCDEVRLCDAPTAGARKIAEIARRVTGLPDQLDWTPTNGKPDYQWVAGHR